MNKYPFLVASVAAATAGMVTAIIVTDPTPGLHMSAPMAPPAVSYIDDEILGSPVVRYKSDSLDYEVVYPSTWELHENPEEFHGHMLSDPAQHVVVTFSVTEEPLLATPEGQEQVARSIEESLRYDATYTPESFSAFTWKGHDVLFAKGQRVIGNTQYLTREYNIIRADHVSMLNIGITMRKNTQQLYENAITDILNSLEVCHDR